MTPQIVTYCSNLDQLTHLLTTPVTHLIFEDPKISLRSFETTIHPGFTHLQTWAQLARQTRPDIQLSFNLDILAHTQHDKIITLLINALKEAKITIIRVQDPGLILLIKTLYPEALIHLNTETGNHNLISLTHYQNMVTRQVLSAELPIPTIHEFRQTLTCELELMVHGPILLQHSKRPFLDRIEPNTTFITTLAEDNEYRGRFYTFHQNLHGHFMFANFDRSLINFIPELMTLHLDAWLIDGRGQSSDYLDTAIRLFCTCARKYAQHPDLWTLNKDDLAALKNTTTRPFKPGFFLANLTDQDRSTPWEDNHHLTHLATALDISKHWIAAEVHHPITSNTQAQWVTPKGREIDYPISEFFSLKNTPLTTAEPGTIILFPKPSHITSQSRLYSPRNR